MRLCSAVHVLDFGALIASGPPDRGARQPCGACGLPRGGGDPEDGRRRRQRHGAAGAVGRCRGGGVGRPRRRSGSGATALAGPPPRPRSSVDDLSVRYGDAIALDGRVVRLRDGHRRSRCSAPTVPARAAWRGPCRGWSRPAAGSVLFAGTDITRRPAHRIRRRGLVHLPEGRGRVPRAYRCIDNLRMAAATIDGRKARRDAVELALRIFPRPGRPARPERPGCCRAASSRCCRWRARWRLAQAHRRRRDVTRPGAARRRPGLRRPGASPRAGVTVIMIEQYVHRALSFRGRLPRPATRQDRLAGASPTPPAARSSATTSVTR